MTDYGISQNAPEFAKNFPENASKLIKYLENEMGVPQYCCLKDLTVKDLMESKLLKKGAANKLIRSWQKESEFNCSEMKTTQTSNTKTAGSRDIYHGSDLSKHSNEFGDHAQVGGSRNVYHGAVDHSQNKTTYGDNSQFGGTRNIRSGPRSIIHNSSLSRSSVNQTCGDVNISYD